MTKKLILNLIAKTYTCASKLYASSKGDVGSFRQSLHCSLCGGVVTPLRIEHTVGLPMTHLVFRLHITQIQLLDSIYLCWLTLSQAFYRHSTARYCWNMWVGIQRVGGNSYSNTYRHAIAQKVAYYTEEKKTQYSEIQFISCKKRFRKRSSWLGLHGIHSFPQPSITYFPFLFIIYFG